MNIGGDSVMQEIVVFKALSDESRLRIINLLMQRELCVCEIEKILDMSQSNVSRHLNKLKNAGIVLSKKQSQWAYYSLNDVFISSNSYLYEHLRSKFLLSNVLLNDIAKFNATEPSRCD